MPSDVRFVARPDTDYSGADIRFSIPIDRYFGDKNLLMDFAGWKTGQGLPKYATLKMMANDIDYDEGEVDEVYFNDHEVSNGHLTGQDEKWSISSFQIPLEWINLPTNAGDVADNNVLVKVDVNGGRWETQVEWATLEIPAPPPVVISHGIWDSAEGNLALSNAVASLGLPVYLKSYRNMGWNSIEDGANQLSEWIDDMCKICGVEKVTLLCHSMGGIKAREYTTEFDQAGAKVDRVIQIGTPNGGADMAKAGTLLLKAGAHGMERLHRMMRFPTKDPANLFLWDAFMQATFEKPAMGQLRPSKMATYNRWHPLNPAVRYTVLAGDCGTISRCNEIVSTWWERMLGYGWLKDGWNFLLNNAIVYANYINEGDGIVSVKSAHTMVPKHSKSPVKNGRAWHGGLVKSRSEQGMVETIVGDILKEDILATKDDASLTQTRTKARMQQPEGVKEMSADEDVTWVDGACIGEASAGQETFHCDFALVGRSNRLAAVNILCEEDFEIESVWSPSGTKYTNNENMVCMCSENGWGLVLLAIPEPGTWTVHAKRKGAWKTEALSYLLIVQEPDSDIGITGGFSPTTARVGSDLELSVQATKAGAGLEGLSGTVVLLAPDGTQHEMDLEEMGGGSYRIRFRASQAGEHVAMVTMTIDGMEFAMTSMATVQSSGAEFGTLRADGPRDDDDDGFYDRLSFSGTLSGVDESATYRVFATLSNNGTEIAWGTTRLTNGETAFRVDFDGTSVYEHGYASKYVVSQLRLFEEGENYEAEIDARDGELDFGWGYENSWSWVNFSHPLLSIPGTGEDAPVEIHEEGHVKNLGVGMDIVYDGSVAGTYDYSISLKTEEGAQIGTAYGTLELPVWDDVARVRLHLEFDGAAIAMSGGGPCYLTDLLLWNDSHAFAPPGAYQTHAWSVDDFIDGDLQHDAATGVTWFYGIDDGVATVWGAWPASGTLVIPDALGGHPVAKIGSGAFYGCDRLAAVTIPDCVTNVGRGAFGNCTQLFAKTALDGVAVVDGWVVGRLGSVTSVELTGIRGIADYAFANDTNLCAVAIGDDAVFIGPHAFEGCISLDSLTIGRDVRYIGNDAFHGCVSLPAVRIPNHVKDIESRTFCGCTGLTNVTIGFSVTNIGEQAFCSNGLSSVTIPDKVASIGDQAFLHCMGLTKVTLGNGLKDIGNEAFRYCISLTNVIIPNSVTHMGHSVFWECQWLKTATINSRMIGPCAFSRCPRLTSVRLGNALTDIGDWAFSSCTGLESVTIPDSVTCIEERAFSDCGGLRSVTMGSGLTHVGESAFEYCTNLCAVYIHDWRAWYGVSFENSAANPLSFAHLLFLNGVQVEGELAIPAGMTAIESGLFAGCTGLTGVTIPDGVTSIGKDAFYGCSNLAAVTIPDGVTSIGSGAFEYCDGLTNMVIPDSVTNFGGGVFSCCSNLLDVTMGNNINGIGDYAFYKCGGLTNVTIPDSATNIGDYAFCNCTGLTAVAIGNGVIDIGKRAFHGCSNMVALTIGESVEEIGFEAFYRCLGLRNVTIPDSVTDIGEDAFRGCSGLTNVVIGFGVTHIGGRAFAGCALTSVLIGDSVENIGYDAFSGCSGLTSVIIPDSVTNIEQAAFYQCSGLTNVVIGNGVTYIGGMAFDSCTGLTSVTIGTGVAGIGQNAFSGCRVLANVAIPDAVTSIGSGAFSACRGLTNLTIGKSVTNIWDSAFDGCSGLTSVSIPNSVTSIGKWAFGGCSGLTCVSIPNSLPFIAEEVFSGCSGLTNVTIPDSVTFIGKHAFSECASLTSVSIPTSIRILGEGAFWGCSGLTSLTIPDSVTSIGDWAYRDCTGLKTATIGSGVTNIGYHAFYGCNGLISLFVPASWKSQYVNGVIWSTYASIPATCSIVYYDLQTAIFDPNGGSCETGRYSYRIGGLYSWLPTPTRFGFSFEGWYASDGGETPITTNSAVGSSTKQTLVAHWKSVSTTTTPVSVPHSWLDGEAASIVAANQGDYEAAARAQAANGMPVWECYLAGLSTTNAMEEFTTSITFSNGVPNISWKPDLNEGEKKTERTYVVEGKPTMLDEWGATNAASRFFRVKVALP